MTRELADLGHRITLIAGGSWPENDFRAKVESLPLGSIPGLRLLSFWVRGYFRLRRVLARERFDVLLLDPFSLFPALLLPKRLRPARMVVDYRTPIDHPDGRPQGLRRRLLGRLQRIALRLGGRHCQGTTVISNHFRQQLIAARVVAPERVAVWGSGVDIDRFHPAVAPDPLPFPAGSFVLVQHGEISSFRGILETVTALSRIQDPAVCLLLVGTGPAVATVLERIVQLGLERRVKLLPPRPHADMPALLAAADLAMMPYPDLEYWRCNLPLKLLEYLALGLPVLATAISSFGEVVGTSDPVTWLAGNDPATLAAAIERRRSIPPRPRMRGEAVREYTWRAQAERLAGFLEELERHGEPG